MQLNELKAVRPHYTCVRIIPARRHVIITGAVTSVRCCGTKTTGMCSVQIIIIPVYGVITSTHDVSHNLIL